MTADRQKQLAGGYHTGGNAGMFRCFITKVTETERRASSHECLALPAGGALVHYEQARVALAEYAKIETPRASDKAEKSRLCSDVRDDDMKCVPTLPRAGIRIGNGCQPDKATPGTTMAERAAERMNFPAAEARPKPLRQRHPASTAGRFEESACRQTLQASEIWVHLCTRNLLTSRY
jgi:hypothetical protein